jgi:hypothetical protein
MTPQLLQNTVNYLTRGYDGVGHVVDLVNNAWPRQNPAWILMDTKQR